MILKTEELDKDILTDNKAVIELLRTAREKLRFGPKDMGSAAWNQAKLPTMRKK
ncbi:MAG: hypothetical protein KGI04_02630 [Candidatus Micrarchaeota archaeon]|nr:hypothetical protein [Candidatus Micrarchaeota archaeon]